MSLRRDRRGAALQVGAVLLLGFLVIALSLYQATVVPEQNKRVEFRHSQAVQDDMVEVRNALRRAGTSDDVQSVSVRMGTTYPPRVFFVNPPPPGGLIRNGSVRSVTVSNASATDGETADFLNSSANGPYELSTENLSYRPGYNVYRAAPTTTYQTGVLVNEFEDANDTAVTGQGLVDGNEIYLVAVRGNLSRARTGAYAVDPESLSTAVDATTISNESGRINVTVPTTLTEERWETLLADEENVESVTKRDGRVSILLKNGTYRLRTALVGIGTGAEAPGPAYLTRVNPDGGADVAVEVRDRFNNPVPNSRVDGTLTVNVTSGTDVLDPNNVTVGEDGRATFDTVGSGSVNLTLEDASGTPVAGVDPATNGSVNLTVTEAEVPGTNQGDPNSTASALIVLNRVEAINNGNSDRIEIDLENTDSTTDAEFIGYKLDFATEVVAASNDVFNDGPNNITSVDFGGTTKSGNAQEYREPYSFSGSPVTLSAGSSFTVTVTLDGNVVGGGNDGALVGITLYVRDVGTLRYTFTLPT